ncbi:MAG: hypothetical protein GY801_09430 [bacterium]|nr:hypothetical protein [bacterium]
MIHRKAMVKKSYSEDTKLVFKDACQWRHDQSPYETSDFIVDCLKLWWEHNRHRYSHITELVLNLDNGPNAVSGRTQFIRRLTEFSDASGLQIHLAHYPPYHSKYNAMVHLWEKVYAKGVRLTKKAMKPYEDRLEGSPSLPKWNVA